MENKDIWIIGAGTIAKEYAKVLDSLKKEYLVIGRSEKKASEFEKETGHKVITGGLEEYIKNIVPEEIPSYAIVAVDIPQLTFVIETLLQLHVPYILVEKPGFATVEELNNLYNLSNISRSRVLIAYNRRFYASVIEAEKIIAKDEGLESFHFEFTEWVKTVIAVKRPEVVLSNWFYANSSHVIDLAFFLGGFPKKLSSYTSGSFDWHRHAIFVGAGETEKNVLFSYCANWNAPGRWGVELLTSKHRLYLKPMETLQIQNLNSVAVNQVEIDDHLDKEFKPGFYLQTKAFIENDFSRFCTLKEQAEHIKWYMQIDE